MWAPDISVPLLCAQCHGEQLSALKEPSGREPHMYRTLPVLSKCKSCSGLGFFDRYESSFDVYNPCHWWYGPAVLAWDTVRCASGAFRDYCLEALDHRTLVTVSLPTELIASHRACVVKHIASASHGSKPNNYEMSLAALVAAEKDAVRREALIVVAPLALRGEYNICWEDTGCLPWRRMRGSTWRRCIGDTLSATCDDSYERECEVISQKDAFRAGGVLVSSVVEVPEGTTENNGEFDADAGVGGREAHPRFPQMYDEPAYLFSNHPACLVASERMRNVDVGDFKPYPSELERLAVVEAALKEHVFTSRRIKACESLLKRAKDTLPKKFTEEQREMMIAGCHTTGEPLDVCFKAFVKSEVSRKKKPRAVVNHGERRCAALCMIAAVYDECLFSALKMASIKGRAKRKALTQIATNMSKMPKEATFIENDLTAFEYGISEELKSVEARILLHIAKQLGCLEEYELNTCEFEAVVDERTQQRGWKMRFKDEDGTFHTLKIFMPRVIRESGDRLTSSGNYLQNVLAWLTFLVATDDVNAAVKDWVDHQGKYFFYKSARDGKRYKAVLAFEGDDTFGRLVEFVEGHVELFMKRWGWCPKLKYFPGVGQHKLTFVGYEILISNGAPVLVEDEVVCFPELKRLLTSKNWSVQIGTEEDRRAAFNVYAAMMAQEYRHLAPMHAFFKALHGDTVGAITDAVPKGVGRDLYLSRFGELGTIEEVTKFCRELEVPECVPDTHYEDLAKLTGSWTAEQWALACSLTTLRMGGDDLRSLFIPSWVSA